MGKQPTALAECVGYSPKRSEPWRSLVRVRSAIGDYDGVITIFAQFEKRLEGAALQRVGVIEPFV
jgi:hypothetical protein